VYIWLDHLGESSGDYRFQLTSVDGSVLYAEGNRVVVKLDPATLRPTPWSEESRAIALTLQR